MSNDDDLLYPPIEPFYSEMFKVSDLHTIYYEQCGNPSGLPVLFCHGGPGGNIAPRDRRYFDPATYHIILFDQRGAGKSTPSYCLLENDTWSLVADMEKLREKVGVERWVIFGGSWGSTLALIYAETHIDRVLGLILRGIFTVRPQEIQWLYQDGASNLYPEKFEELLEPIPKEERDDLVKAYYKRLNGNDEEVRLKCAKAWNTWEMTLSQLNPNSDDLERVEIDTTWCLAHSRIECHYIINNGFMKLNQILDDAGIIGESGIPVTIIQGRYDIVCPVKTAWDLKKSLPKSEIHIVGAAGHSAKESGITAKLVEACNKYKSIKM